MLRHYDKIGLLKPSYIKDNGYRYYSDEEMHKISIIKQLRRYEFSLEEIDKIICKNDSEYTKQMLQLKTLRRKLGQDCKRCSRLCLFFMTSRSEYILDTRH